MNIKKYFSSLTSVLVERETNDYISKDLDEQSVIESLKRSHGLKQVYRFDIGKNTWPLTAYT